MAKTKIVSEEEIKNNKLRSIMSDFEYIPEPSYTFNVGDKVSIGNLRECIVVDVLENGKIYEIDYTQIDNNYGRPIVHEHVRSFWKWFHVRPMQAENHNFIRNQDLRLTYSQRQLEGIIHLAYDFGVEMNPSYQRDYVWTSEDDELLIDSVFSNIDIGKFVFVHRPYKGSTKLYEILDGKQRLRALHSFYENRFPYKGLFYNDLSKREQSHFDDYSVSYAQLENVTEEQKIKTFLMLNRTGRVMDKNHLEKVEKLLGN